MIIADAGTKRFTTHDGNQIVVEPYFEGDLVRIYYGRRNGDDYYNYQLDKSGQFEITKISNGETKEKIKPFLTLSRPIWENLVEVVRELKDPRPEIPVNGALEATRYHLEDLRTLLKLTKGEA